MNELDSWIVAASAELGLSPQDVSAKAVLDVARDVAHQVLRPGAPVTAYLMGVAVGRGADPAAVAGQLSALARSWPSRTSAAGAEAPDGGMAPAETSDGGRAGSETPDGGSAGVGDSR